MTNKSAVYNYIVGHNCPNQRVNKGELTSLYKGPLLRMLTPRTKPGVTTQSTYMYSKVVIADTVYKYINL